MRTRRWRHKRVWVREILSPAEARVTYPRVWEVVCTLLPELTDDQRARVVSIVTDTCAACHQADASCRCRSMPGVLAGPSELSGARGSPSARDRYPELGH
jgi:mono/diheme cytochrome c family protein